MRWSAGTVANLAAWFVLLLLAVGAIMVADRLGFVGLLLLGAVTWLICALTELDQDAPTWGAEVFKARMQRHHSPEQRAALLEERRTIVSPLRFYRRCGIVLVVIGAAGFAWQQWASR